jgi:hypothetical protein
MNGGNVLRNAETCTLSWVLVSSLPRDYYYSSPQILEGGYAPVQYTQAIREGGAPLVLAAPLEKGALPAPLLYQPVGTENLEARSEAII